MTTNPPPIPTDEPWEDRYRAKQAFAEAATTLTDSILALDSGRDLLDDRKAKETLADLFTSRKRIRDALYDTGLSEGFRPDDVGASGTERVRRAWMAVKSGLASDPRVLKVLLDEEHDAMGRLEKTLDRGLPAPVDRTVRNAIENVQDGIDQLETALG